MANSIDVGCESGGDVNDSLKALFEAVKAKGTSIQMVADSDSQWFSPTDEYLVILAIKAINNYYITIYQHPAGVLGSSYTDAIYYDSSHAARFYWGSNINDSRWFAVQELTGGWYYLSDWAAVGVEACWAQAPTYNDLMSQLGGGIKPYYILSPIIILEVREYGKQCRYWVRRQWNRICV